MFPKPVSLKLTVRSPVVESMLSVAVKIDWPQATPSPNSRTAANETPPRAANNAMVCAKTVQRIVNGENFQWRNQTSPWDQTERIEVCLT